MELKRLSIGERFGIKTPLFPLCGWLRLPAIGLALLSLAHGRVSPSIPNRPDQVEAGSSVTVTVTDGLALVLSDSVQWYRNDTLIPGATGASLHLSNVTSADSGNYRVDLRRSPTEPHRWYSEEALVNVFTPPAPRVDRTFSAANATGSVKGIDADGNILLEQWSAGDVYSYKWFAADGRAGPTLAYPASAGRILAILGDGSLITTSAPYRLARDGNALPFVLPAKFSTTKLSAAVGSSDGTFYCAQGVQLGRFDATGKLDPNFVFQPTESAQINDLFIDLQHRLLVYQGGRGSERHLFRLLSSGALDPSFVPLPRIVEYEARVFPLRSGGYLIESNPSDVLQNFERFGEDGVRVANWVSYAVTHWPATVDAEGNVYVEVGGFREIGGEPAIAHYKVTDSGLQSDPHFYPGFPRNEIASFGGAFLQPDGRLLISGNFHNWDGHLTNGLVRLDLRTASTPLPPPAVGISKSAVNPPGSTTLLTSGVNENAGPFSYQWLALDGQSLPTVSTGPELAVPLSPGYGGRYQLRVTGPGGSTLSNVAQTDIVALEPGTSDSLPFLANLSGRALSGTGENTVIAGLTTQVSGNAHLSTLIRAAGPALLPLGVQTFLADPSLHLLGAGGVAIDTNDDWSANSGVAEAAQKVGAFSLAANSKDAALLHSFTNGNATIHVGKQNGADGAALVEIYRLPEPLSTTSTNDARLVNLSFRARNAPGDATVIAGFVITDPQDLNRSVRVLVRAIGPTLSASGISQPLENPILTVYNSKAEVLARNDDWFTNTTTAENTALVAAMRKVGAFDLATNSRDSALLLDLPPGAYTMHAGGGTGVVLLEIYLVP